MIVARTQTWNEACDECDLDYLIMASNHKNCELINISSDRLSSEGHLTKEQAIEFMKGRSKTVGLMDPINFFKAACT